MTAALHLKAPILLLQRRGLMLGLNSRSGAAVNILVTPHAPDVTYCLVGLAYEPRCISAKTYLGKCDNTTAAEVGTKAVTA